MIPVTRPSMPQLEEYIDEIQSVFESAHITNGGEKHNKLEEALQRYLGVSNLALFCNGHTALETCLQAMELTGQVITTPFTFASTTHAVVRSGLTPVFCDIRPDDYTMNPDELEPLITEHTSAILPVHVYGNVCQVERIQAIADKYRLKVIYDAAHAFGVALDGRGIGSFGDASMFSFHATKVFHTIEGGAAVFQDNELKHRLESLRNFGMAGKEEVILPGGNGKMSEFHAAMGLCNLRHFEEEVEKRKQNVLRYRERLQGKKGLALCGQPPNVKANYAYFPVVFYHPVFGKSRDQVAAELEREGIFPRKYFYPLTNAFPCYEGRFPAGTTPVAQCIAENVLTLPLYAGLTLNEVDRICDVILK